MKKERVPVLNHFATSKRRKLLYKQKCGNLWRCYVEAFKKLLNEKKQGTEGWNCSV